MSDRASEVVPARVLGGDVAVVALGALLVLPLGLSDGGYFGRSLTALTLALGATAALGLLRSAGLLLSNELVAAAVALALLAAWVGLSSLWAVDGAGVELEARRCILYAVALAAVALVVDGRRRVFLYGLTAAVSALAVVGLWMRSVSGSRSTRTTGACSRSRSATRTRSVFWLQWVWSWRSGCRRRVTAVRGRCRAPLRS